MDQDSPESKVPRGTEEDQESTDRGVLPDPKPLSVGVDVHRGQVDFNLSGEHITYVHEYLFEEDVRDQFQPEDCDMTLNHV